MKCAWDELLAVLPVSMRSDVDRLGRETLQQLRLRLGSPPLLERKNGDVTLTKTVNADDLSFVVQMASRYSPWASGTISQGYLTTRGGHRIGLCGEAVNREGSMAGIRVPTSLCLRVARQLTELGQWTETLTGSVLIIGPPGSGKTTLLREVIRRRSDAGYTVAVVDERGELFPEGACFEKGLRTDVMSGCCKEDGLNCVLRTMSPHTIAVDEITKGADTASLMHAAWCGVKLLATAHAWDREDLLRRGLYRPLTENGLFDTLLIMGCDQTSRMERMESC